MFFNNFEFIILVLPISVTGYFYINSFKKYELSNYFLLIISFFFYLESGLINLLILMSIASINYLLCKKIYRNKNILRFLIGFDILALFVFKYLVFVFNNIFKLSYNISIVTPLAISFFIFTEISFVVDSYNKELSVDFLNFLLYSFYFPKMIQGPLMKIDEFISQIKNEELKTINYTNLVNGLILFSNGLAKKVLLAEVFCKAANWGYSNIDILDSASAIIVVLSYTFQIYFDFSGYSDMAVGVSKMLNIEIIQNFNSPYKATDISDFWKRWHISLTNFLTKYLYFPLGGNRKGKIRTYLNIIIVFIVSGIWHGANYTYLFWGLLNGIFMVLYRWLGKYYDKMTKHFRVLLTFILVSFLWIFFRADSIGDAIKILNAILSFKFNPLNIKLIMCFNLTLFEYISLQVPYLSIFKTSRFYLIGYMAAGFIFSCLVENTQIKINKNQIKKKDYIVSSILLTWSILSLTGVTSFIYAGF